jgi:uncharacterized membrane protein
VATENVVVVTFPEPSKAYQALSTLKQLDADRKVMLHAAAVVERQPDGRLNVPEQVGGLGLTGTTTGGLIGALVGILGGPFGVLLGWSAGSLIGAARDVNDATQTGSVLGAAGEHLPTGATGLIADVDENTNDVLDGAMKQLGGSIWRQPAAQVEAEIQAEQDAARKADQEEKRRRREEQADAFIDGVKDRIDQVRDRLERL